MGILTNSCPAFKQIQGKAEVFLVSAFSQLPSVLNNPYAKVVNFEVAYSGPQ